MTTVPHYHKHQVFSHIDSSFDSLMRIVSARFNVDPEKSMYVLAPCIDDQPYTLDKDLDGYTACRNGKELSEEYVYVGEAEEGVKT